MPTCTWSSFSAGPTDLLLPPALPRRVGEPLADALLAAARETRELWADGELRYPNLADDIPIEARLAPS